MHWFLTLLAPGRRLQRTSTFQLGSVELRPGTMLLLVEATRFACTTVQVEADFTALPP